MEKILNYKDLINGKQIKSVYGEYGNWVTIDEWLDLGYADSYGKKDEEKYYLLFSNHTLKLGKPHHSEELYLVTAVRRGLELFILDYYYINSIKGNDRWGALAVLEEIKTTKQLKDMLDFKKTYFVHDIKSFYNMGVVMITCINDISPHKPLSYYV